MPGTDKKNKKILCMPGFLTSSFFILASGYNFLYNVEISLLIFTLAIMLLYDVLFFVDFHF